LCYVLKNDKLGKPGNLKKHLKIHDLLKFWLTKYENNRNNISESNFIEKMDDEKLALVKFFINSNIALQALNEVPPTTFT
jgi:hypothetical protein